MADLPREQPLKSVERRAKVAARIERRKQQVAPLLAQRATLTEIADTLGSSISTIHRDAKDPVVQHDLKFYRDRIKQQLLEGLADNVVAPAIAMARQKAVEGEARDFDATMRGINALEKTTASASGEAQRVQLDATVTKVDRRELYGRLEALIEHVQST